MAVQLSFTHFFRTWSWSECVKGTELYVSADNSGAHSFAGFQESFTVQRPRRHCMAQRSDIQQREVRSGACECRTSQDHDRQVSEVLENPNLVKKSSVLIDNLEHFCTVTGFPPDIMHDLLEGIIPVEMSLCINDMIPKKKHHPWILEQTHQTFSLQVHWQDWSASDYSSHICLKRYDWR